MFNQKRSLHNTYYPIKQNKYPDANKTIQEKLTKYFENKNKSEYNFLSPVKLDFCIKNKKEYLGLGFEKGESIAIPNVITKTRIFAPYNKKNRLFYEHVNLAPEETNFEVWATGLQCSYVDFYRMFATFDIYWRITNLIVGVEAEIDLREICKKLEIKASGDNLNLIYNALTILKNNKYKITTYGKQRKTVIHKVGYDVPFSFITKLTREKNTIKITFDPRIAIFYVTAKTDMKGKIIYKNGQVMIRKTYGICNTKYFKKGKNRLKGFASFFLFKELGTNACIQTINIEKIKEYLSLKSSISQIKFKIRQYSTQLVENLFSECSIEEENILKLISADNKRERLKNEIFKRFKNIEELSETFPKERKVNPIGFILKLQNQTKKLLRTAKRNGIQAAEICVNFLQWEHFFKNESKRQKRHYDGIIGFLQPIFKDRGNLENRLPTFSPPFSPPFAYE